ncbi:MAG: DUF1553 domain-containing protein [Candidatus Hydrogenedentes bacterium]|nr:DUF1553 domain-containing protein [Candidatus Hydrogenedentota bacterium]
MLGLLEEALRDAHYDLRQIYRLILNSRTYQQSCVPRSEHPDAAALFAHYSVRRVDAEVLIDALDGLLGSEEEYSSPIPEPFTYLPEHQRTVALGDGSITSPFLEMFGRPARDTGLESERNNEPSDAQSLYLLNSSQVQRKIEDSRRLRELLRSTRRNPPAAVRTIYLHLLSRYPTMEELGAVRDYARANALPPLQTVQDLVWALINSKEFLYRH